MTSKSFIIASISTLAIVAAILYSVHQKTESLIDHPSLQEESDLMCVGRSTMIARAEDWVNKHVPYSQTGSHDGYRTDCSGFVSMSWMLSKPGLTTSTMHTVATNIAKDSLQPGDAINCDGHHIVLFAGWTSSDKTHYVAMEEANTKEGTVKKVIPYPYFNGDTCFHPIRYNGVC